MKNIANSLLSNSCLGHSIMTHTVRENVVNKINVLRHQYPEAWHPLYPDHLGKSRQSPRPQNGQKSWNSGIVVVGYVDELTPFIIHSINAKPKWEWPNIRTVNRLISFFAWSNLQIQQHWNFPQKVNSMEHCIKGIIFHREYQDETSDIDRQHIFSTGNCYFGTLQCHLAYNLQKDFLK